MQRLEVSGAVRLIYKLLGVKGLNLLVDGPFSLVDKPRITIRRGEVMSEVEMNK